MNENSEINGINGINDSNEPNELNGNNGFFVQYPASSIQYHVYSGNNELNENNGFVIQYPASSIEYHVYSDTNEINGINDINEPGDINDRSVFVISFVLTCECRSHIMRVIIEMLIPEAT